VDICPQISPCSLTFRSTGRSERGATYIPMVDSTIQIINTCYSGKVKIQEIIGTAYLTDIPNALMVTFSNIPNLSSLIPNYFIEWTDYDNYSIIRSGDFNYENQHVWILSRYIYIHIHDYSFLLSKLPPYMWKLVVPNNLPYI